MNQFTDNLKVKIKEQPSFLKTQIVAILEDIYTSEKIVKEFHNVVCTVGKVAIARKLAGIGLKTNEGQITYGATGTDSGAVNAADVKLGTEIARKQLSSTSYTNNTCELRVFFNASESVDSLEEFGLFGEDATAVADSGTIFNHALMSLVKSNTQTLTISVIFTIA